MKDQTAQVCRRSGYDLESERKKRVEEGGGVEGEGTERRQKKRDSRGQGMVAANERELERGRLRQI